MNNIILIQRLVHAATGILILFLVTNFLTIHEQGWYYAFLTLVGFYTLFDFGYSESLLHISSSKSDDMEKLLKYSAPRYFKSSIIFFILFTIIGYFLFSYQDQNLSYNWVPIWILLCFCASIFLFLIPIFSILQGTGYIKDVYSVKLIQNILSIIFFIIIVFYLKGLLATVSITVSAIIVQAFYLIRKHKQAFCIYIRSVRTADSTRLPNNSFVLHVYKHLDAVPNF